MPHEILFKSWQPFQELTMNNTRDQQQTDIQAQIIRSNSRNRLNMVSSQFILKITDVIRKGEQQLARVAEKYKASRGQLYGARQKLGLGICYEGDKLCGGGFVMIMQRPEVNRGNIYQHILEQFMQSTQRQFTNKKPRKIPEQSKTQKRVQSRENGKRQDLQLTEKRGVSTEEKSIQTTKFKKKHLLRQKSVERKVVNDGIGKHCLQKFEKSSKDNLKKKVIKNK